MVAFAQGGRIGSLGRKERARKHAGDLSAKAIARSWS
jgi:hypothetical protein